MTNYPQRRITRPPNYGQSTVVRGIHDNEKATGAAIFYENRHITTSLLKSFDVGIQMLIQKSIIVKFAKNNIDHQSMFKTFGLFKHGQETDDYSFVEHEEKEALSTLDIYLDAVIDQLGIRTARDFVLRHTTTHLLWYYKVVGKKPNAGETRKLYEIAGLDNRNLRDLAAGFGSELIVSGATKEPKQQQQMKT